MTTRLPRSSDSFTVLSVRCRCKVWGKVANFEHDKPRLLDARQMPLPIRVRR